jgi:hypothetical protein
MDQGTGPGPLRFEQIAVLNSFDLRGDNVLEVTMWSTLTDESSSVKNTADVRVDGDGAVN